MDLIGEDSGSSVRHTKETYVNTKKILSILFSNLNERVLMTLCNQPVDLYLAMRENFFFILHILMKSNFDKILSIYCI